MQIGIVAKRIGLSVGAIRFLELAGSWRLDGQATLPLLLRTAVIVRPRNLRLPLRHQRGRWRRFNTDDVRKEFNASGEKVRVVALLSPTCPGCQSGHAVIGR